MSVCKNHISLKDFFVSKKLLEINRLTKNIGPCFFAINTVMEKSSDTNYKLLYKTQLKPRTDFCTFKAHTVPSIIYVLVVVIRCKNLVKVVRPEM